MGYLTDRQTNKHMHMFAGEIEWETSELEGDISDLPVSAAVGGTGSVLMVEGIPIQAYGMHQSSGENYHLALTVPQGEMVVVSSPDSKYNARTSEENMAGIELQTRIKNFF